MKKFLFVLSFMALQPLFLSAHELTSPDGSLILKFLVNKQGEPCYSLLYKGKTVIENSRMGFLIKWSSPLNKDFVIESLSRHSYDETWETVWGENRFIRNHYHEMSILLHQKLTSRKLIIRFRLFNDGLGFRYEFPEQANLHHFIIEEELTEFLLAEDQKAFWLPGDYDTNEFPTTTSKLSEVSKLIDSVRDEPLAAKSPTANLAVQTPLMLVSDRNIYMNIHEAALFNYPAMHLNLDDKSFCLSAHLTPDIRGNKGYMQTGDISPWRTIIISDDARDILSSNLILNLNSPCILNDVSWIKPMKYIGVWWEYFTGGGSTWAYAAPQNIRIGETDYAQLKPSGTHGANTEHIKAYIDFAAEHNFDGVLIEGWNEGWEDNVAFIKDEIYSFTTPYPDFDIKELQHYAALKGIELIMHHETTSAVTSYERQLEDAFRFMKAHGYNSVKTGYVGPIIPRSEYHDGQWMVNHYNYIIQKAAEYQIMVNSHEAVRPTGIHRTYPNWLAQESARGTEFESFNGNRPDHTTILPFTRLIGGPMDYTPGIFQGDLSIYGNKQVKISSTLAKQLALYVVIYSPLQMAADLPENYIRFLNAFQFIKDVALDWDQTYILEAEPGDYVTIARKTRDIEEWFIGGITDENAREAVIDCSFLPTGKKYTATIYSDGKDADWQEKPQSYSIKTISVNNKSRIKQKLAPGGGVAIHIH